MLKRLALASLLSLAAVSAHADPIGQPQLMYQGPLTVNHCLKVLSANGTLVDSGSTCGGSASGVTISPATGNTVGDVTTMQNTTTGIQDSGTPLASLAPLASPAFTGNPTAPTQLCSDSSIKIATTAYVQCPLTSSASPLGSRFSASTANTKAIPFAMSTCTNVGTSQGGLTYTENANRAWSLYLSNGSGHANSVVGWICPFSALGNAPFDIAIGFSYMDGIANSGNENGIVTGFSDGTGVDAFGTRGNLLSFYSSFTAGAAGSTITPIVRNAPFIGGPATSATVSTGAQMLSPVFERIKDDGTDVWLYDSNDGVTWQLWAEWALSAHETSGAYTYVYFGMANGNGESAAYADKQFSVYLIDLAAASRGASLLRPY